MIIANPTPCQPFAKINAVAGPRLENCPRASSR